MRAIRLHRRTRIDRADEKSHDLIPGWSKYEKTATGLFRHRRYGVPNGDALANAGYHLWKAAENQAEKGAGINEMVRWVESMTDTRITSGDRHHKYLKYA